MYAVMVHIYARNLLSHNSNTHVTRIFRKGICTTHYKSTYDEEYPPRQNVDEEISGKRLGNDEPAPDRKHQERLI